MGGFGSSWRARSPTTSTWPSRWRRPRRGDASVITTTPTGTRSATASQPRSFISFYARPGCCSGRAQAGEESRRRADVAPQRLLAAFGVALAAPALDLEQLIQQARRQRPLRIDPALQQRKAEHDGAERRGRAM